MSMAEAPWERGDGSRGEVRAIGPRTDAEAAAEHAAEGGGAAEAGRLAHAPRSAEEFVAFDLFTPDRERWVDKDVRLVAFLGGVDDDDALVDVDLGGS